jgi:hypothetical protein
MPLPAHIMSVSVVSPTSISITRGSPFTTTQSTMILPISLAQWVSAHRAWQDGTLIQVAFPTLNADQREFIMTGLTPAQWNEIFETPLPPDNEV